MSNSRRALLQRSADARTFAAWLFQLLASSAWVVSVIIYDSYETGDIFQLLAALCWTLSNVVAMPEAILPLLARQKPLEVGGAGGDKA